MKTLLIIGGTGFFGNSILKYFSYFKYPKKKIKKIIIISRKNFNKVDYIKKLKKSFKVVKINCDILKLKKLPFADYVIYAAVLKNYKHDHLAVRNYINLAKIYHTGSQILYTSSGAVYGKQLNKVFGFKENYLKINKKINFETSYKQPYSILKLKNEKLFQQLTNFGAKVSIARCFTFTGEFLPLNSNYVIGNFIQNILKKEDICINSFHKIYRSYMYSDDLARWLLKILLNSSEKCQIYNVGSDDIVSIHDVANILSAKYKLKVNKKKILSDKIDKYVPNIQKIKKELNLSNKFSSINAIIKTINLLKKNEKNY